MITPGAYLCVVIVTYMARARCNELALLIVEGGTGIAVEHIEWLSPFDAEY